MPTSTASALWTTTSPVARSPTATFPQVCLIRTWGPISIASGVARQEPPGQTSAERPAAANGRNRAAPEPRIKLCRLVGECNGCYRRCDCFRTNRENVMWQCEPLGHVSERHESEPKEVLAMTNTSWPNPRRSITSALAASDSFQHSLIIASGGTLSNSDCAPVSTSAHNPRHRSLRGGSTEVRDLLGPSRATELGPRRCHPDRRDAEATRFRCSPVE